MGDGTTYLPIRIGIRRRAGSDDRLPGKQFSARALGHVFGPYPLRTAKSGHQRKDEDHRDSNHDEQLNEGETTDITPTLEILHVALLFLPLSGSVLTSINTNDYTTTTFLKQTRANK